MKNGILVANYETTDLEEKVNPCKISYRKVRDLSIKQLEIYLLDAIIPPLIYSQKRGTTILPWGTLNTRSYQ